MPGRSRSASAFSLRAVSLTIGVITGLAAGYYGGKLDDALQALINLIIAIPFLPLLIVISSLIRMDWKGPRHPAGSARLDRRQPPGPRTGAVHQAARLYPRGAPVGASHTRIMFQHILPNVFSIVLVIVGFDVASAILIESGLSFLGFGVQPPTATWGNMLTNSLSYTTKYPWLCSTPASLFPSPCFRYSSSRTACVTRWTRGSAGRR